MFEYFPGNYAWSLSVLWASEVTGTFSEIHDAIKDLLPISTQDPHVGGAAWYAAWTNLAAQKRKTALDAKRHGYVQTHGRQLFRAGIYSLMAVRFLPRDDARGDRSYEQGTAEVLEGLRLLGKAATAISVPYQNGALPGLLSLPAGVPKAPCVIVFGGFDSLKEWIFPLLVDPFLARGVGVFVVDQAGVGGALRLHKLPALVEAERSAAACIDALAKIEGVAANRIGLAGISLGGYYAPRAAAFESRIRAACAWGGIWDLGALFDRLAAEPGKARSIPDMLDHATWVFGTRTKEEAMSVARKMTLAGDVIERVRCPLLVLHGINDRQVMRGVSEQTVSNAVNSPRAELKVFDFDEGGAEHCQIDNCALAADYMADWFSEVLGEAVG